MKTDNEMTTITIELIGSYTARHADSGRTVDRGDQKNRKAPKSAISPLCRLLIDEGYDPALKVHIVRKALDHDGFTSSFKRDRTLSAWAGVDCVETETRSLHVTKYRPLPAAVKGKERRETPEVTQSTSETETLKKAA